jgi:hypothetical protein
MPIHICVFSSLHITPFSSKIWELTFQVTVEALVQNGFSFEARLIYVVPMRKGEALN